MSETTKEPSARVLMMLWAAFLATHMIFLFIGLSLRDPSTEVVGDLGLISAVLTGAGVMTALASALAVPLIAGQMNFFTATQLRFALAESATIFGLILAKLGADTQWTFILTGLGVVAHIAAVPTQRERELHEQKRARDDHG